MIQMELEKMVFDFESKSADGTTAISERSQNVTNISNEEFDLIGTLDDFYKFKNKYSKIF